MNQIILALLLWGSAFTLFTQKASIEKISLHTYTRGYSKTIHLRQDSIRVEENARGGQEVHQRALQAEEWQQLMEALNEVDPRELPKLEGPTSRRASDAALHAELSIQTTDAEYSTPSFDEPRPHSKLEPLIKTISNLAEAGRK